MKLIFHIFLIFPIFDIFLCTKEDLNEGNILLKMKGEKLELNLQGTKKGNKKYYTIPLKFGTPPKTFNVQLDTSVTTSWVPSVKCKNCRLSTNFYNVSESSTSSKTSYEDDVEGEEIILDDEDGDVEGFIVNDDIILNDYKLNNLVLFK